MAGKRRLHASTPHLQEGLNLTICFEKIVRNLAALINIPQGSDLREESRAIAELVIKATSTVERLRVLYEI